ncbi:MAG: tryptophan synthase subunit alpha [Gammaproteobacteria bacterium]
MTVDRIQQRFTALASARRAGLVTFITAGDPDPSATLEYMHALVRGGADLLELGVPFSDPMADGPVIQRASERALAGGMTLAKVFEIVTRFRAQDATTPVVLMGYLNPIERMGYAEFARRAAAAGVDGVLTVDLPPEEAHDAHTEFDRHGLRQIHLLAPTSDAARMEAICARASGFVYYVSVKGVTGGKAIEPDEVRRRIAELKRHTRVPVGVGFGVRSPDAAAALAGVSDAVIVGSALVEIVERHGTGTAAAAAALELFAHELRVAMDARRAA